MSKRQEPVRAPRQLRSQRRVEKILDATKTLILSKGCAHLKMGDIATEAGISAGSIYQYFPNKNAIISALADRYLDANRESVKEALAVPPASVDDLLETMMMLVKTYVQLHLSDPVVYDIWSGLASDKELQDVEKEDTRLNAEQVFAQSKHLFNEKQHDQLFAALLMLGHFVGTSVAVIVDQDDEHREVMAEQARTMIRACWESNIKPLAKAPSPSC